MKATIDTTITMGSTDVFTDLGFSPAESSNLRILRDDDGAAEVH